MPIFTSAVTPIRKPPVARPTANLNSLMTSQPAPITNVRQPPIRLPQFSNNGLPAHGTGVQTPTPTPLTTTPQVTALPQLGFAAGQDTANQSVTMANDALAKDGTKDDNTKTNAEPDFMAQIEAEYGGIMADDAKSWGNQQHTLQGEMAGFQRSADSMNARMGGGIGGGSAGLAGAALGQGMSAYNSAAMEYNNRRRATQMAWLDKKIAEGQRQQEHTWDVEQSAKDTEAQLIMAGLSNGEYALKDLAGSDMLNNNPDAAAITKNAETRQHKLDVRHKRNAQARMLESLGYPAAQAKAQAEQMFPY